MKKYFIAFLVVASIFGFNAQATQAKIKKKVVKTHETKIYGPMDVPMVYQARGAEWHDPRLADGCEEASVEMAHDWIHGISPDPGLSKTDILALSDVEKQNFGFYEDTSAEDTAKLLTQFYGDTAYVQENISIEDIKGALLRGELVIVPINGAKVGYYRSGPPRHTVVVKGYDQISDRFIINDPVRGANIFVSAKRLQSALRDYNSGVHLPVPDSRTAIIRVIR